MTSSFTACYSRELLAWGQGRRIDPYGRVAGVEVVRAELTNRIPAPSSRGSVGTKREAMLVARADGNYSFTVKKRCSCIGVYGGRHQALNDRIAVYPKLATCVV